MDRPSGQQSHPDQVPQPPLPTCPEYQGWPADCGSGVARCSLQAPSLPRHSPPPARAAIAAPAASDLAVSPPSPWHRHPAPARTGPARQSPPTAAWRARHQSAPLRQAATAWHDHPPPACAATTRSAPQHRSAPPWPLSAQCWAPTATTPVPRHRPRSGTPPPTGPTPPVPRRACAPPPTAQGWVRPTR